MARRDGIGGTGSLCRGMKGKGGGMECLGSDRGQQDERWEI